MAEKRIVWREEGALEGALIRSIFLFLVAVSVGMLALDLRDQLDLTLDEGAEQVTRVVIQLPTRTDQERPYFPKALPVIPGSGSPKMPGVPDKPTRDMVAGRMSFHVGANGDVSAVGRIETGSSDDFEKFLDHDGKGAKTIWLLSPGGSVPDAITMGRSVRKRGLDTMVADNGYCASSCPLMFAGGVRRTAGKHALIGVHQVSAVAKGTETWGDGISAAQQISARCVEYLVSMGVDPDSWIKAMRTPKERLYIFRTDELHVLKITTGAAKT